jgi:hypothetical protein
LAITFTLVQLPDLSFSCLEDFFTPLLSRQSCNSLLFFFVLFLLLLFF